MKPNLLESSARSYCRTFPATFDTASSSKITDEKGRCYLDFLSGCGSLNYGHNNELLKKALLRHIQRNGITMSMDMHSTSKDAFLIAFTEIIAHPRNLSYRMQFCGPTGTNAVEAAIKLARKVTGRTEIIAFTNAFHGCTIGSLALTANNYHRQSSIAQLTHVTRWPYDGYHGSGINTAKQLQQMLDDPSSGLNPPAAIIVETVQGEGGLNIASSEWLQCLSVIAQKTNSLLIIDDVQAGCGRTGTFLSFEDCDIEPDIVILAKSLSGYGLPMSMLLIRPEYDQWEPGEHNGTFRGNNLAFVTATEALHTYWDTMKFQTEVQAKAMRLSEALFAIAQNFNFKHKGRGMMQGLDVGNPILAAAIQAHSFKNGLIFETCGSHDTVIKLLPPLTIDENSLMHGLSLLEASCEESILHFSPDLEIKKNKLVM